MIPIQNETGFPHFWFEKLGTDGQAYNIVVMRATYAFAANGAVVELAEAQDPICLADEYEGPVEDAPLEAVLRKDGDLVSFKPSTDVHVVGRARPPGGQPVESWVARVAVGPVEKRLRLLGPRRFVRGEGGWRVTAPEPVDSVALDYRLGFGGAFAVDADELEGDETQYLTKRDNPAGQGWLPSDDDYERISEQARTIVRARVEEVRELSAPQIEHPDEPVNSPHDEAYVEGFGPLARWWEPRIELAGTFDEAWQKNVAPAFPEDFDPDFYQSAHPDLISDEWLRGDEEIVLEGMLEQGEVRMRLPGLVHAAAAKRRSGQVTGGRMQLDTISVDLDRGTVNLVWRGAFSKGDPAVALHIREVSGVLASRESAREEAPAAPEGR